VPSALTHSQGTSQRKTSGGRNVLVVLCMSLFPLRQYYMHLSQYDEGDIAWRCFCLENLQKSSVLLIISFFFQ